MVGPVPFGGGYIWNVYPHYPFDGDLPFVGYVPLLVPLLPCGYVAFTEPFVDLIAGSTRCCPLHAFTRLRSFDSYPLVALIYALLLVVGWDIDSLLLWGHCYVVVRYTLPHVTLD